MTDIDGGGPLVAADILTEIVAPGRFAMAYGVAPSRPAADESPLTPQPRW
ncbi:MAG: hypothetical protein OXI26_07460 [bacterium]|nr:hypothetical protein [bacterium]